MRKLLTFLALMLLPAVASAQTLLSSSPAITTTSTPLILYVQQYQEWNLTLTSNTAINFYVPVISGSLIFRLNICENGVGGFSPVYSIVQTGNTFVNNLGSTMFNTAASHCETQTFSWRQQSKQLVLEADTAITGAPSQTLPLNQLPNQTGAYNAQGFAIGGLPAVTATGQALSEGHAIGGTTPAAGTFTALNSTSGTLNGSIGATTPSTGAFTALTANGAISVTGGSASTASSISNLAVNGVVNPLDAKYGVICDGSTDNTTAFQNAINAAETISNTGTGHVIIPAVCNSANALAFASTITVPDNIVVEGLAGVCDSINNCVSLRYTGNNTAITTTGNIGTVFKNFNLYTTTGATGIQVTGGFKFVADGINVYGFSGDGFEYTVGNSGSSVIHSNVNNSSFTHNGTNIHITATAQSSKAVGAVQFVNNEAEGALSANQNIKIDSATGVANTYQISFENMDMSAITGGAYATATGMVINGGANIYMSNVTAENLQTIFSLNQGTQNFEAFDVEGDLGSSPSALFTADAASTYLICWGLIGGANGSQECDSNIVHHTGYLEFAGAQDVTGQAGIGQITNLVTFSEDFTQAAWATSHITSVTANTAVAPNGKTTASAVVLASGAGTAIVSQEYNNGGSIANTCWKGTVWAKTSSGVVPMQPQFRGATSGNVPSDSIVHTYYLNSTNWQRMSVDGEWGNGQTDTQFFFRVISTQGATIPTATIDLWGAQLQQTTCPNGAETAAEAPYIKTGSTAITSTQVGSINPSFVTGLTPGISGGGSLSTGSNSYSGTVTGSAATGNVITPGMVCPHSVVCVLGDDTTLGGAKVTATSATSCTYAATASDTVDYLASCR